MNRLVLVMWVLVSVGGAMSISAAADDHGKHPKQGKCIAKAMTHLYCRPLHRSHTKEAP